jgi:SSS family solute:Na+ symporter
MGARFGDIGYREAAKDSTRRKPAMIHGIDLAIILLSLVGLIGLAGWIARRQETTSDYYLGGRHLPAWALGSSLAANQVSAISLVGAPAFVALREGGGLRWLQYELAVPLALAILIVWVVPVLRRAGGADVYAAVESRLGKGPRRTLAAFFLLGRGLGAGVILYTSSLVVSALTGWGLASSLAVVAFVAVAYTTLGGLVADVISDVFQLGLLWAGTATATVVLAVQLADDGGWWRNIETSRLVPLDFAGHGLGDGATFAFWPMLFGGLFLYVSYYGCDQTQAQRILAAPSIREARRALVFAALIRFPLVLTYCAFGLLLAALLAADPAFAASLVGRPPDALVPQFLATHVPVGVKGLAVAGILAAALSSLDSALNSLSAVSLEEFFPRIAARGDRASLRWARAGTVAWGVWAALTSWWFSQAGETVIELVNRVGSVVYGPILALFLLAWRSRRADARSSVTGALAGVLVNVALAQFVPSISWLWWNVTGCLVTLAVAHTTGAAARAPVPAPTQTPSASQDDEDENRDRRRYALLLVAEFGLILTGLGLLTFLASS